MIEKYIKVIKNKLDEIYFEEKENMQNASKVISNTLKSEGLIYVFGCGHSHAFGEELFYRAGGLANIYPILYEPLMLHKGPMRSSLLERENNYAHNVVSKYTFTSNDVLIAISSSGINPVTIDVAKYAEEHGVNVITITSNEYSMSRDTRHKDGLRLKDIGIVSIDNKVPVGDAALRADGVETAFGPISTILGMVIIQSIIADSILYATKEGVPVPIFLSGNLQHSDEHNKALVKKYGDKVPLLIEGVDLSD